jgi:hypothetical protein
VLRWRGSVLGDDRRASDRRGGAAADRRRAGRAGDPGRLTRAGEAAPRSDLDFLVVEPEVDDDGGEAVRLMRGLRDLRVPTDVIVMSERYAEDWRDVRRSLLHAALSQGRVLAG